MLMPARGKYSHFGVELGGMHRNSAFYLGPSFIDHFAIYPHDCLLEADMPEGNTVPFLDTEHTDMER